MRQVTCEGLRARGGNRLRQLGHRPRHTRSYEREVVIFDPLHHLALLERKTRALGQAAPLAGWQLPDCFAGLRRLLEARLKKNGSREYVQVLRILEIFASTEVTHAIEDALRLCESAASTLTATFGLYRSEKAACPESG